MEITFLSFVGTQAYIYVGTPLEAYRTALEDSQLTEADLQAAVEDDKVRYTTLQNKAGQLHDISQLL